MANQLRKLTELSLSPTQKSIAKQLLKIIGFIILDPEHNLLQERSDVRSYAAEQLKEIEDGTANLMRFRIQEGRSITKIIQEEYDTFQNRNEYRDGSVHSFVDKNNGNVYKPASWKAPHTKHVRFTFQKPEDIRKLLDPNY